MTYKEFDKKYNIRNYQGVIQECSIINFDGKVIFRGSLNEVENFWDENVNFVWKDHKVVSEEINGEKVTMTNLANYSWYRDPILDRLNFEVK